MNETTPPEGVKADVLNNIRIVLVSPIYSGNIGSICRAMKNCGLSQLVIAEPRHTIENLEAQKMALHASDIFENRREYPTLAAAVADCGLVVGTTARLGLYRCHAKTPRDVAPQMIATAHTSPVALVFGPEDNGLGNEHLTLCTRLIQIPSSSKYSSLNIAQAVMICSYELFLLTDGFDRAAYELSPAAPSELKEKMFELWREVMLGIDFMDLDKADHMMLGLRRALNRGTLSSADTKILIGIARQILWYLTQYPLAAKEKENQTPPTSPIQANQAGITS